MVSDFLTSLESAVGRDIVIQAIKDLIVENMTARTHVFEAFDEVVEATDEVVKSEPTFASATLASKKKWAKMTSSERVAFLRASRAANKTFKEMSQEVSASVSNLASWASKHKIKKAPASASH